MPWLLGISIILLMIIAYQDIRTYSVSWVLFPLLALLLAYINITKTPNTYFLLSIAINGLIVSFTLLVLYVYSRYKMKLPFSTVFGLGDILFFYAFALGFPSASFIVLFVFSIFFSLVIHFIINFNSEEKHVPLAGFMSIFLILVIIIDIIIPSISLYNY